MELNLVKTHESIPELNECLERKIKNHCCGASCSRTELHHGNVSWALFHLCHNVLVLVLFLTSLLIGLGGYVSSVIG